ncbi:hypothetical protein PIB30_050356 [Stylosanthes scabra]|uniref:Uncharacterized protein n=1 Tax=Stylosanthes scabra TaxID=79078 RepID=A0ABU6YI38_9FABA|nr:hypothetical protein [Stylosanthes scabra]
MWYKDPQVAQYEIGLMWFDLDRATLDMVRIAQQSGYVELFVVHEGDQEGFPKIGYIDVGGDPPAGSDDDNEEEAAPNVGDAAGGENVGPNAEGVAVAAENDTNAEGAVASGDNNGPTAEGLHVGVEEEPIGDGEAVVVDEGEAAQGEVDASIKGVDANDEGVEAAAEGVEAAAPDHDNEMQIKDDNVVGRESEEDNSGDGEYVPSEENSDNADDVHFTDSEDDLDLGDSFFGNNANEGEGDLRDKGKQKVNDDFSGDEGEESEDIKEGHAVGGEEDGDFGEEGERVVYPVHKAKANMAEYKWQVGTVFKKKIENNPKVKIKELVAKADRKWNLTISSSMVAQSKQRALEQIHGTFREQYRRLGDYAAELLRMNPSSVST